MDFNLLITTFRHREFDALDELNVLLSRFGVEAPMIEIQKVSGILLAFANLNTFDLMVKFKKFDNGKTYFKSDTFMVIQSRLIRK